MQPIPLDQIRFRWKDHKAALWWLGLLYRRPEVFELSFSPIKSSIAVRASCVLYLHALPYLLFLAVLTALARTWSAATFYPNTSFAWDCLSAFLSELVPEIMGIVGGIGVVIVGSVGRFVVRVIVSVITGVIAWGFAGGFAGLITGLIAWGITGTFAWGITGTFAWGIAWGIILGFFVSITWGIAWGIATTIVSLRVFYYPLHLLLLWPTPKGHRYPWHPVAWDDLCSVPFIGLDRLLVAYAEHDPRAGVAEIVRIIDHYPAQRMAALSARVRLIARETAAQADLSRLEHLVSHLPEGEKRFLAWTAKLRNQVREISQAQLRLNALDRPYLKEPTAELLKEKIINFRGRVSGYPRPLAEEFGKAADRWLEIAEEQYRRLHTIVAREPTPQVFRAGDPVDRTREAFLRRENVLIDLERSITLATGCPGLLLYGRRRMGKSSLLKNLEGLLPPGIRVVTFSMQNPGLFTSQEHLLRALSAGIEGLWPTKGAHRDDGRTLEGFFTLLRECDTRLKNDGERLLLCIDEYEYLDVKIGEGIFDRDLPATIRESIQYHRNITWIFAGSHLIGDLPHADWTSYLISALTLEVPPFSEAETRLLLTHPMRHSEFYRQDEARRPTFSESFWGEGGIERIQRETAGWPHLVQLLAMTVVDLCNDTGKTSADPNLLETAIAKSVGTGTNVLEQLLIGESTEPELTYLRGFRRLDTQPVPEDETVYRGLRKRQLVTEAENGEWTLRVPLMLRWLRERG